MRKFGILFITLIMCLIGNCNIAKADAAVTITDDRFKVGQSIHISKDDSVTSVKWYVNGRAVNTGSSDLYKLKTSDYEKWISVKAYDSNDELIGEDEIYFSRLPVAYINTVNNETIVDRENYIKAEMNVQGNDEYDLQYNGSISIKARGKQSYTLFPKKSYKLKLDDGTDMFGFGKSKHWVLLANYQDESLVKNTIAQDISAKMGLVGADTTWVDVVLNGTYIGNYQFSEQIRVDKNRVDIFNWEDEAEAIAKAIYKVEKQNGMTKDERDTIDELLENDFSWINTDKLEYNNKEYKISDYYEYNTNIKGGYLFELSMFNPRYDLDNVESVFKTNRGMRVIVDKPEMAVTNDEMMSFVRKYWDDFEEAYYSVDGYNKEGKHYSQYVDMDSLVRYWLLEEISGNTDMAARSRWCYMDTDGLIYFGPVWDHDYGFGTNGDIGWKYTPVKMNDNLFKELVDDPYFLIKAQEEYWKIRPYMNKILSSNGKLEQYYTYLYESGHANSSLWGKDYGYVSAYVRLYESMKKRLSWLDGIFNDQNSIIASLHFASSSNPYTKSPDIIGITLENAVDDNQGEIIKNNGVILDDEDLNLTINVKDELTTSIKIYINGLFYKEQSNDVLPIALTVPKEDLTADKDSANVISVIGYNDSGEATYTNFVTVAQVDEIKKAPIYVPTIISTQETTTQADTKEENNIAVPATTEQVITSEEKEVDDKQAKAKQVNIKITTVGKKLKYKNVKSDKITLKRNKKYKLKITTAGKVAYKLGSKNIIKITKKNNILQIKTLKKGSTTLTLKVGGASRKLKMKVK